MVLLESLTTQPAQRRGSISAQKLSAEQFDTVNRCLQLVNRAVTRALIGGGGGCIFIYSCSARRISFEISCFQVHFKRNQSDRTRMYEIHPTN